MATSLLNRRSNSTASLSKYFHELPDPDQTSIDFCNSFWGPNDCGVEVLFARIRGGARTMEELRVFWKERIAIEEDYAKRLVKLAKLPLGRDEIGDLRAALDMLRAETDAQAAQHLTFVQTMKRELDQPTNDFIGKQNNHKKTFQAAIEKSYKAKQTQEKYVEKAREKYESDCVLINSYTAQSTLLQGKELDKIQTKLDRAQQTVQANERDYQNFARALGDTCKRWEGEWKTYCDQCQDLEDERIEFIKDNVWAYANAVSTVCVSDDESCEKIRVHLEQVDADKEMEHFVRDYGTGPMMSEPMPFISYKQSSPPGRPKQKLANFLRSSVRAPLMRPTLPVGPPEVEPNGPGAAGIGAGGGKDKDSRDFVNGKDTLANARQGPAADKGPLPVQARAPMTPASQASTLSYQQTGTSLASIGTVSTTRNQPIQPTQRDSRQGVDPPTMLSIGGNAYPVDTTADPQSARNFTGAVGDQNDPIAQALDALKKGGGVTRNGVGSIRARPGMSPAPASTTSIPTSKPAIPSAPEAPRNKAVDYRDYANSVVGAHPSSRPTSPMSPPRAAMMQPPSNGPQDFSQLHQQAFPGERRLSISRGQSTQQPGPVRSPSPARDGFAGIGAQGRSPSPQPFNRAPSPGVPLPGPTPSAYAGNPTNQRPISSAGYRATSPSFGIALDASGQVAQDSMADEYARRSQYAQPGQHQPPQNPQYQQPLNQGYQQPQSTGYQQQQQQPQSQYGGPNGYSAGPPQQTPTPSGGPPNQSYNNQQSYQPQAPQGPAGGSYPQQQLPRAPSPAVRRSPSPAPAAAPPQAGSSNPSQYTDEGANVLFYVKALYDYKSTIPEEFDFQAGDIIAVTATPDDGWWSGMLLDDTRRIPGRTVFPSNFVCLF